MDFLSHILWANLLFRKKEWKYEGVFFALIPDITFVPILAFFILKLDSELIQVFRTFWKVTFLSHSVLIMLVFFATASIYLKRYYYPLFFGWGLHILIDTITHKGGIRAGFPSGARWFYPVSTLKIEGLVNYETLGFMVINWLALILIYAYLYLPLNEQKYLKH